MAIPLKLAMLCVPNASPPAVARAFEPKAIGVVSFNRGPVKEDYERLTLIGDWLIADDMECDVVCAFSFGHAGNAVCRVQGRLRGRDMPAAG